MPSRDVQLSPAHLRVIASRDPDPEQQAISAESSGENDRARRVAERLAAKREASWRAIQVRFPGLSPRRRGALVAYWSDIEGEPIESIAARFDYRPNTLSVNKARALALHDACVLDDRQICTCSSHCAHVAGEEVLNAIAADSAATILREVDDELGPE